MSTLQERGRLARAQSEALLGRSLRFFDESQHPRDEHGRWTSEGEEGPTAFVSPNVSTLTFEQAVAALYSKQQANLLAVGSFIDGKLGVHSSNYPAIGAWSDGAENSMMVHAPGASTAQMRAASAMKGYLADQKAVLIFHPSDSEESDEHLLHFDVASDATKLHEKLLQDGLAFHTLQPLGGDHYRVHVYASDQATVDAVAKSAKGFKADVTAVPGKGEFLGTTKDTGSDREQRDDARRVYDKTIKEIAASGELQDLARTWDEVRNHWQSVSEAKGLTALLRAAHDVSDELRDERGRWAIDIAATEAKAKEGVEAAAAKDKQAPLKGSKATHPATVATRQPRSKGSATDTYGQPGLAAMKANEKFYNDDVGLFHDASEYPQFKPGELQECI